jgi:hypothetical protein
MSYPGSGPRSDIVTVGRGGLRRSHGVGNWNPQCLPQNGQIPRVDYPLVTCRGE